MQTLGREVSDGSEVKLSWQVRDLSSRCDLAAPIAAWERSTPFSRRPRMRQALASGASQLPPSEAQLSASKVCDIAFLYKSSAAVFSEEVYTAGTRSVLINPLSGKWKENLSSLDSLSLRYGVTLASRLLSPPKDLRDQPAQGLEPMEVGEYDLRLRHMPVLTDFRISLGVFNARSDGRHRVRLHSHFTFWNPSALALLTSADKRLFLAEIEGAPEITVRNLDSGATFSTWLDRCPAGNFWTYSQGPRESTLWWWTDVLDSTRHGMSRSGILPGEVYSMLVPDPSVQPFGIARVIGKETWRYDASDHPPGWNRPSPEVFLPTDRIVISVRFITPGVTLRLRPYVGLLNAHTLAENYPSPVLYALRHIPWPDAHLELSGADYSRADSNGYVISERRLSWHARLKPRNQAEALEWADSRSFMQGDIDLIYPEQVRRWDITKDPLTEASAVSDTLTRPAQGVFWDAYLNQHAALTSGAYADIRTRTLPIDPPQDWFVLSQLLGQSPEAAWDNLDSTFFACPEPDTSEVKSENPRIVPWVEVMSEEAKVLQRQTLCGVDAAGILTTEGTFNVNTESPLAWRAFLESDAVDWRADLGGPSLSGVLKSTFLTFSQPSGARLAKFGSAHASDISDEVFKKADAETQLDAIGRQSVRSLSDESRTRFCEELALRIQARAKPFAGVADFFKSKVLEESIEAAQLNEGIPKGSPMYLDGPRILGAFLPFLVARGDTFQVSGVAEIGGAKAVLELTVQRYPDASAQGHLGRKMRVTHARWR